MSSGELAEQTRWVDAVLLRQGLYRLLAAVLRPPTAERVASMRQAAPVLDAMGVTDFPFAAPVLSLLEALQQPGDLLAANVEHVRLFESGVDGALCPPTESYYLTDAVGSVIAELQRDCLRLGLRLRHDVGLEPDHVSALLEVQSALCAAEVQAWEADDREAVARAVRDQRWFLERHLGRWVDAFVVRLGRADAASPYREAGPAVQAVVRSDRQLLAALAHQLEEVRA